MSHTRSTVPVFSRVIVTAFSPVASCGSQILSIVKLGTTHSKLAVSRSSTVKSGSA